MNREIRNRNIIFITTILVMVITWSLILRFSIETVRSQQETEIENEFLSVCNELDLNINRTLTFVYGLRGYVYSHHGEEISQESFNAFASETQNYAFAIKNFSIAPNNVQKFVYPFAGNEQTLGHDLANDERENVRNDVKEAMETGEIVISGPYPLRQGGLGMVIRNPIFIEGYWGLVNVVVDIDTIIEATHLMTEHANIDFSIFAKGDTFWETSEGLDYNMTHEISVGTDTWIVKGTRDVALSQDRVFQILLTNSISFVLIALIGYLVIRLLFRNVVLSDKVKDLIFRDILTNLPNRRALEQELNKLITSNTAFALAFLDLDNFKDINDTLGHSYGDEILRIVTRRIINNTSYDSFRWGGDEFIIIVPLSKDTNILDELRVISGAINLPVTIRDDHYYITSSIGVSMYPKDGETPEEIIKLADATMYACKSSGKNDIRLYSEDIGSSIQKEFDLIRKLEKALENGILDVYYQPQYEMINQKMVSSEALIRWPLEDGSFVSPGLFIPIAERSNLIQHIDEYVIKRVFSDMDRWMKEGYCLPVAINISASHFNQTLVDFLLDILPEHSIKPHMIELEITETTAISNFEQVQSLIKLLRTMGFSIALDDFGTGYSSLGNLSQLDISTLKIDRSFIYQLHEVSNDVTIVESVITIAKTLGLDVVAEGIENKEQLNLLRQMGCDKCQGFLFSKAIQAIELEEKLKKTHKNS